MLNMLRRLDKIRFRGHKRDDFLDLAESPNASDTECGDETPLKIPRTSPRDSDELRDPVSTECPPLCVAADARPLAGGWGLSPSSGGQAERAMGRPCPAQAGQTQTGLFPISPQTSPSLTLD